MQMHAPTHAQAGMCAYAWRVRSTARSTGSQDGTTATLLDLDSLVGASVRAVQALAAGATTPKAATPLTATDCWRTARIVFQVQPQRLDVDRPVDDTDPLPILDVILPGHPKGTIVSVLVVACAFDMRVLAPELALVAPVALPLAGAPWISDLYESMCGSHAHHAGDLLHVQDAVGMASVEPICATGPRGAQHALQSVVLQQHLEHCSVVKLLTTRSQIASSAIFLVVHIH